jgi:hypothetical protein
MNITPESRAIINENFSRESLKAMFELLDDIRESGQVNMMGSASILREAGLVRSQAHAVSRAWMATFSDAPVEQRVEEAYEEIYSLLKN